MSGWQIHTTQKVYSYIRSGLLDGTAQSCFIIRKKRKLKTKKNVFEQKKNKHTTTKNQLYDDEKHKKKEN